MITFDLGGLNKEQLEQALGNNGYNMSDGLDREYPNAGIQEIISVHPRHGFGDQQEWLYEVVFNNDGSFDEEDTRRGNLYVSFDTKSMRVVADF